MPFILELSGSTYDDDYFSGSGSSNIEEPLRSDGNLSIGLWVFIGFVSLICCYCFLICCHDNLSKCANSVYICIESIYYKILKVYNSIKHCFNILKFRYCCGKHASTHTVINSHFKIPLTLTKNNDIDRECNICLSGSKTMVVLKCGHIYHRACITQWAKTQIMNNSVPSCPSCRLPIVNTYETKIEPRQTTYVRYPESDSSYSYSDY